MTIDIDRIKSETDIAQIVALRVALSPAKSKGEFLGLCPFHGEATPSFTVNPAKGFYHCFGCGAHGDVFDFLRETDGMALREAAEFITGTEHQAQHAPARVIAPPAPDWISSKPPENCQYPRSFGVGDLGDPAAIWPYLDEFGDLLGYVCRYQDGDKKVPLTWTWGTDGTKPMGWAIKGFTTPRPLFGLNRLAARPSSQVIMGEGEKTVSAIEALFPGQVAVGWPGGTNGVAHVDFSPLAGRRVVIVPDADDPGRAAAAVIKKILEGIGCQVKIADPEADRPKGWDLADALADGWTQEQAKEWIRARVPQPPPEPVKAAPDPKDDRAWLLREFSEIGLSESFTASFGENWRYVPEWGKWYEWMGDRWRFDELSAIQQSAIYHLKSIESDNRSSMLTPIQKRGICSAKTVKAVQTLSSSAPNIATPHALMDANPWLLGVPGGAIDLRTGHLIPADKKHLISKQCTVCPVRSEPTRWLAFLNQVMLGRQDQIDFLQRFSGYALVGKLFEPGLAFLHGGGGNGKGVVLNTLIGILGDYAVSADFSTFAEQEYGERHSTDVARLAGARLVVSEEGKQDQKLNESLIKKLTGGGKMTARFMMKDNFEFEFAAKIIVASNHKPSLSSVGEDMKRRINMIPFDFTVPEEERDQYLGEKLKEEYPKILHWIIQGCMKWQDLDGLHAPDSIKALSRGYIKAQDPISEFIDDTFEIGSGMETPALVYREYQKWCEKNGERGMSRRKLLEKMEGHSGINFKMTSMGKMVDGLNLRLQ